MVFILRNKSDIQRFAIIRYRYAIGEDIVMKNVYRWIVQAVKRNVKEMSLKISQGHPEALEIPHQLVNCKSLVHLEMQVNFGFKCTDAMLPKSMDLPRLKVLWIHGVSIPNEELSKRIFSSFPVLEKLFVYHCDIPNLTVNSLSLENFVYKRLPGSTDNVIKLTTPNLKYFQCMSCVTQLYSLENCSLLFEVNFKLDLKERVLGENTEAYCNFLSHEEMVYAKHMTKFLREACMVRNMWLSYGLLEVLSEAPDLLLDSEPPCLFNMLSFWMKMRFTRGCLWAITYLLKISPRVQSILLYSKQSNLVDVGDDWDAGLSSQGCCLASLMFLSTMWKDVMLNSNF
ncbi:putative F-box/FBD/LRR-repeat protein At1g78760 [Papaver somniferum]|uniref:putative F-box/FBD/LRR-repeat protein At1g78760 n=1 Tax=Papaver somniferum TaxID=3469 RepID=UPI000E701C41|nr:putative F-box/FBD/LRR-repeat protein At1g78760 [Papaver somniferum]